MFDMFILNLILTINLKTAKREAFYLVLPLVKWGLRHDENLFPENCISHSFCTRGQKVKSSQQEAA